MDWSAIAGAGLSLLSNIYGTMYGADRADADRELTVDLFNRSRDFQNEDKAWSEDYAKRMMKYQYDKYSSPSAQVAALRSAGLNPFLMSGSGSVGSGQGVGVPSVSVPQRGVSPDVMRPNPVTGQFGNTGALIAQSSALSNERLSSLSKILNAAPDTYKALGKDGFNRFMTSIFGQVIDSSIIANISESQALNAQHEEKLNDIKSKVAESTSMQYANNLVSLQQMEFAKYSGEFNLMQSEIEANKSKIHVAASEYVRNIADALHLKKVGDYYEASANTINALRDLTRQSLEYRVHSQWRNDITEQTLFEAQRGLREHITEEGQKINDRFIQNWDIETDPFYNEVSKMLNSWHISTNVGFSGSYGSKDVYGHGFGY